jgi:transposase
VFVDESGLSQKPQRVRTWAPKGQTPVLAFDFNWQKRSVMAGLTVWNCYCQFFPDALKGAQVVHFLQHLQRHLPGKLRLRWDGAASHRCRLVQAYLARQRGQLVAATLPADAPELNPTEYLWGYFKHHQWPNFCARDLAPLSAFGRRKLANLRRRPKRITAFWKQALLW